ARAAALERQPPSKVARERPAPVTSNAPAALRVSTPATAPADAAAALSHHHKLMAKFLEAHQNVMLEYLGPTDVARVPAVNVRQPIDTPVRAVAELEPIERQPAAPPKTADVEAAPSSAAFSEDETIRRLVALVSERTGYPPDVLGLDLDLEADLGVDSIKRVEIVSAMQNVGLLAGRDGNMEVLSKLKTLRAIAKWVASPPQDAAEACVAALPAASVAPPFRAANAADPAGQNARATAADDQPLTRMTVAVVD